MVRSQRHLREFYGVDSAGEGGGGNLPSYPPGVVAAPWDARYVWDLQTSDDVGPQVSVFKVPGVDALPAGASWTPATRRLNLNAGTVLDGWDLSDTIGGGFITVNGAGCTIRNCLLDGVVKDAVADFPYLVQVRLSIDSPGLLIEYCHINGKKRANPTAAGINNGVNSGGMIVQYCIIEGLNADNINCASSAEIRYNHIIIGGWGVGSHADAVQSNGGAVNMHHNVIDMTNVGQPAGTINTAALLSYSLGVPASSVHENVIFGYAAQDAYPVNLSNSPGMDVYDNVIEVNNTGQWRYPLTQGRITRSDGNINFADGTALPEYPVNITLPSITGDAKVGQVLIANVGSWTGPAGTYAFQWKRGVVNIAGANASTYTPVTADVGSALSVVVTRNLASPNTGSSYASSPQTAVVVDQPFIVDADTYWWDFDFAGNVTDTVGHTTLAIARERINGLVEPWQPNKARQPLKVAGGIDCNQATNRGLIIEFPKLTNGKNGWYLAGVIQPAVTNVQIMSIARASSTAMSRMDMLVNGSRYVGFRAAPGDGASPAYVAYAGQITLGQVYAFEILWDFDLDTVDIWFGGVHQTLALGPTGGPWSNFPATNPSDIRIGNTILDNLSFSGTIRQLIFHDGVPTPEQRTSISDYNLARAA